MHRLHWITDTQISAGGPEDPERLGTIADRCLVPRAWLMRNERPELSLVGVISRTREVAEIRKLSRQLKTPPKPETGRPGRDLPGIGPLAISGQRCHPRS